MFHRITCLFFLFLLCPLAGVAQERSFKLHAPQMLVETGFLKHLLPRFSLKTGVRIVLVPDLSAAEANLAPEGDGQPVFSDKTRTWRFSGATQNTHVTRFSDWLTSEIGLRTIEAFAPDGTQLFTRPLQKKAVVEKTVFEGDPSVGETVALRHCGRCHVVSSANKMGTIGSTPSFALMRTFADWHIRFSAFFTLNPHPAFTQIEGVTEPFDPTRPSPIAPLLLTPDELEAIVAFVARIKPAHLGAPIQTQ